MFELGTKRNKRAAISFGTHNIVPDELLRSTLLMKNANELRSLSNLVCESNLNCLLGKGLSLQGQGYYIEGDDQRKGNQYFKKPDSLRAECM